MYQFLRQCFWVAVLCLFLSCSHSPERTATAPQQKLTDSGTAQGTPTVEVVETSFDFGELKEDEDYVHDFKVKNTGNGVLEIKKVLPG